MKNNTSSNIEEYEKIWDEMEKLEPLTPSTETKKTWIIPVQTAKVDGVDDYYIEFPDDLLKAANLKEGDLLDWVDNGDGSVTMKKLKSV